MVTWPCCCIESCLTVEQIQRVCLKVELQCLVLSACVCSSYFPSRWDGRLYLYFMSSEDWNVLVAAPSSCRASWLDMPAHLSCVNMRQKCGAASSPYILARVAGCMKVSVAACGCSRIFSVLQLLCILRGLIGSWGASLHSVRVCVCLCGCPCKVFRQKGKMWDVLSSRISSSGCSSASSSTQGGVFPFSMPNLSIYVCWSIRVGVYPLQTPHTLPSPSCYLINTS